MLQEGRAHWGSVSPAGAGGGGYSAPSTGLSEEAPIRLFAEVTGRILSHRGELKGQLSAIAYWKTEEVVLFHGAALCPLQHFQTPTSLPLARGWGRALALVCVSGTEPSRVWL